MAIWQYDLFLVPEGSPLPTLTDDGWETPSLPAASTLGAQRALANVMGAPWLMMDDWIVFGSETGTRVDLLFDASGNVEIMVRLNASSATRVELDAVCAFASELRSRFFDPATGTPIPPERARIAAALATSRAAAFARAPRAFLQGLPSV